MTRARHWLALAAMLFSAALLPAQTASAEVLQPNAIVTSTDFGFSPPNVTIALGGTVVFTNQGSVAHEVKTGSAPIFVDLALSAGQTVPLVFSLPGVYHYTAATDCGPGANKPLFSCADYTVNCDRCASGLGNSRQHCASGSAAARGTDCSTRGARSRRAA